MKKESKVAWLKGEPFTQEVLYRLREGSPVDHGDLLAAVNDPDNEKVFDPRSSEPLRKENFVIFQYGVYLQRGDGKVAVFRRDRYDQGNDRINAGNSILLSTSTPDEPFFAIPRLLEATLCVGHRERMGGFEPVGMAWNHVLPKPGQREGPAYLFALYRHQFPDHVPLHGRFRDLPDELLDWHEPAELPARFGKSGFLDQCLARSLALGGFAPVQDGDDFIFSPTSYLTGTKHGHEAFERRQYSEGYNVFISHVSEDSFSAFALHLFLLKESDRRVFPRIDSVDLRDGESTDKIDRLIQDCDGVVVVITPSLHERSRRAAESGAKDWVRYEVELARQLGKPVIGFKLGTFARPDWFPRDIVVNNRDPHTDWLPEVAGLVKSIEEVFARARN